MINTNFTFIAVHHIARIGFDYYNLQVCIARNCFLHNNIMLLNEWHHILISYMVSTDLLLDVFVNG